MPKKTTEPKKTKAAKSEENVMWVRLPQATNIEGLKKLGLKGAACYGGDTCIAAPAFDPAAGIVIQPDFGATLKAKGLNPRAACFGGDTCIV
jgi:hypothetical protein